MCKRVKVSVDFNAILPFMVAFWKKPGKTTDSGNLMNGMPPKALFQAEIIGLLWKRWIVILSVKIGSGGMSGDRNKEESR